MPTQVDLAPYEHLPWHDLGLAEPTQVELAQLAAVTHAALTTDLAPGAGVTAALLAMARRLPTAVPSISEEQARAFAADWAGRWAALASRPLAERVGWCALAAEATHHWWPPGAPEHVRGLVQLVVRGGLVEELHATASDGLVAAQIGTMALTWAAATGIMGRVGPDLDGDPDLGSVAEDPFADAARFPGGLDVVLAAGRCVEAGHTKAALPVIAHPGSSEAEASRWLDEHAGSAIVQRSDERGATTSRSGWSAPAPRFLDPRRGERTVVRDLHRLSRHPAHLAAALQYLRARGSTVVAPNIVVGPKVIYLHRPGSAVPRHPEHLELLGRLGREGSAVV